MKTTNFFFTLSFTTIFFFIFGYIKEGDVYPFNNPTDLQVSEDLKEIQI